MKPDFWGYFHDGWISNIEGEVPGDILIHVSIEYLREMLPTPGEDFIIRLSGCTQLEFEPFDEETITDIGKIKGLELDILSMTTVEPASIFCTFKAGGSHYGDLKLAYLSAQLTLDTGEPVLDEQLEQATEDYWRSKNRDRAPSADQ
jgi:hypothetical protein